MSRVELYERIRKDNRDEGLSIRALAQKHRVHRRTVARRWRRRLRRSVRRLSVSRRRWGRG